MFIAFYISAILANMLPRYMTDNGDVFTKWQAVSFALMAAGTIWYGRTKYDRAILDFTILLAINNVIDETLGNPYKVSKFELIYAISVLLWTIYRLKECHTKVNG